MPRHRFERSITVCALPQTAFAFFTESDLFASWWGPGSSIEPAPGGAVRIVFPNGVVVSGLVEEIEPPHRIRFTYGYEEGQGPIPQGSTPVTVELRGEAHHTDVQLTHEFDEAAARDAHVPGWRHQLGLFANLVAKRQHADLDAQHDRFFQAQLLEDLTERQRALEALVTEDFVFRDTFACVRGAQEFAEYLEAARQHGPALPIARRGSVRHNQGTAVCDWAIVGPDGSDFLTGSNVVRLAADGRFAEVSGSGNCRARGRESRGLEVAELLQPSARLGRHRARPEVAVGLA